MPFKNYHPELMGFATVSPGGDVEAGSWGEFVLTYTAGKFGIDDRGSIKITFRSSTDHTSLQLDDPERAGYTSIAVSNESPISAWYTSRRNIRPWHHTLYIQVHRHLSPGDTISVRIGDRSQGGPGYRVQTFCEDSFEFRVYADPFATYDYIPLIDENQAFVRIVPGKAINWKAVIPTLRRPNDYFSLGLKCEDKWGNPSDQISQKVFLECSAGIEGLPEFVAFKPGDRSKRIDNLRIAEVCDNVVIAARDENGLLLCQSNPIRISSQMAYSHFWSDMHGQSEETVGTNTARSYFEFARDLAFMDICGHQGNDFQITDAFWNELNELTSEFNSDGKFLAIPGYEWSGNTCVGGDHNVWYKQEGRPIYRSSRALVDDTSNPDTDCHTSNDLFEKLKHEDALVTAHVGGRPANVNFAHDGWIEPSVEVHSAWGTFEWIVSDAFEAGYRVGIVAASDGHKGRPGSSYPGASRFGSYGGYTCHLMDQLVRDDLFEAFRRRHHYATTGARMLLDVSAQSTGKFQVFHRNPDFGPSVASTADALMMGDISKCSADSVTFDVDVVGTAGLERVDIMDGFEIIESYRTYKESDLGSRIRIVCEGAEYRGRGRNVHWDCKVTLTENTIENYRYFNFWNPDKLPEQTDAYTIAWECVTTGGRSAVDIDVASIDSGVLEFKSNQVEFSVPVSEIGFEEFCRDCGGLGKRVRVYRLPDGDVDNRLSVSRQCIIPKTGDARLLARVTQMDLHMGWSSPIYIFRE